MKYLVSGRVRARIGAPVVLAIAIATGAIATGAFAAGGSGGIGSGETGENGEPTPESTEGGVFPVRGKHTYGDGLGAGRNHQGQDLIAKCGKPVLAAEPGRVRVKKYHSAAGNYVVINGAGKIEDMVYMHLRERSPLRVGQKVAAGQRIGRVGDTGRASTCHLHFEVWSNPGWYKGGEPIDPTPLLRAWDRQGKRNR